MSPNRRGRPPRKAATVSQSTSGSAGSTNPPAAPAVVSEAPVIPVVESQSPPTPVSIHEEENSAENTSPAPHTPSHSNPPSESPQTINAEAGAGVSEVKRVIPPTPVITKNVTLVPAVINPRARPVTGIPRLDDTMEDLRENRHCIWLGDTRMMNRNCYWGTNGRANTSTLQWKNDAPDNSMNMEGDAIIGFLGSVSLDGTNLTPDAGWQVAYGEERLPKHKRTCPITCPPSSTSIPREFWTKQIDSAKRAIEDGRKLSSGGSGIVGHSFLDAEFGNMRVRATLFLPKPIVVESDNNDSDGSGVEGETHLPDEHRYPTWSIPNREVRDAFDRVIELGFEPQLLDAYDRFNHLIHPNNVQANLPGAIVLVYCTLEKALFTRKNNQRNVEHEWQFYANLIKIQVLRQTHSKKSSGANKRKVVDDSGSAGASGSAGSSSKKARKQVRSEISVN